MNGAAQQTLAEVAMTQAPAGSVPESIMAAMQADADPKRKVRQYLAILRALEYDGGKTDEQLEEITGIRPNSLRPRRGELAGNPRTDAAGEEIAADALIYRTPGGTTSSGRKAARWWLTDLGQWVVEQTRDWRPDDE